MKPIKTILSATLALTLLTTTSMANEETDHHWGYTGHNTPETWGALSSKYHTCSDGLNQSPINITHSILDSHHLPLNLAYTKGSNEVVNNGHTIQVNVDKGDTLILDGLTFELKQFHFHSPSENHINGKAFPLELHFVHVDSRDEIAVVSVMFEEGPENADLAKIWKVMPKNAGEKSPLKVEDIARNLIPEKQHYYRFNGSLTTPPCTEGVRWVVLEKTLSVSKAQVKAFQEVIHHPNNRPIQPLDARIIIEE